MDYLADTVALILHIGKAKKMGKKAQRILSDADIGKHRIFVSAVSLMEILYLAEKGRITIDLDKIIQFIDRIDNYQEVPVTGKIITVAKTIDDVPELHDRIIAATANYMDVPILTSDRIIGSSKHIHCIWK